MKHINIHTIIAFILTPLTRSTLPPFDFDNINLANFLSINEFRTIDGTNNNLQNPSWGSAFSPMQRCLDPDYSDGFNSVSGKTRMNPRELSNVLASQIPEDSDKFINNRYLTQFAWQWGQFIDHDITLISEDETSPDPTLDINIYVPCCDPIFDSQCVCDANTFIELIRTPAIDDTGSVPGNPRNQINDITSFIDASMIYGSDQERANELRKFESGLLKTSISDDGERILPLNVNGFSNSPDESATNFFLAGDPRSNEQIGLIAIHTVFVRLHNRLATQIRPGVRASNPDATQPELDELLYQYARMLVTAIVQKITIKDWLPALFGDGAMTSYLPEYQGYDNTVNPGICSIFASSAFRFGHTMLPQKLPLRLNNCKGVPTFFEEDLDLKAAFFTPSYIQTNADEYLRAMVYGFSCTLSNEIDTRHTDAVRNFLFESAVDDQGAPLFHHLDLISINIQRGREHGLPDYNSVRREMNLSPLTSFDDLSSDATLNHDFEVLYDKDIEDIDLFLGVLAEDHVQGGSFGETISKVVLEQFGRLRDGDRFWYESYIQDGALKNWIENIQLKDVLEAVVDINDLRVLDDRYRSVFRNTRAKSIFAADSSSGHKGSHSSEKALIAEEYEDNTDLSVKTEETHQLNGDNYMGWLFVGITIVCGVLALLVFIWICVCCKRPNQNKAGDSKLNENRDDAKNVEEVKEEASMEVVTKKEEEIMDDTNTNMETAEYELYDQQNIIR